MNCVDPMQELLMIKETRSARMEETSMNEIKSINKNSKLISIELSEMTYVA